MKDKISPHQGILEVTDSNFFQEINTLESLLSFDCTLEIINNLMQFYIQAIEHYESLHDPSFLLYTKKLQNLLRKPEVLSLLSSQKSPPSSPKHKIKSPKELSCERIIEKTFQILQSEHSITSLKIQENLKQQNENFYSKLRTRKKKISQKKQFLAFEQGVEQIMEEFVEVKGNCIKEVRAKYSESLKELKNMKQNEIVKNVVQELERRMDEEVENRVEEIEKCKKDEIQRLKCAVRLQIG